MGRLNLTDESSSLNVDLYGSLSTLKNPRPLSSSGPSKGKSHLENKSGLQHGVAREVGLWHDLGPSSRRLNHGLGEDSFRPMTGRLLTLGRSGGGVHCRQRLRSGGGRHDEVSKSVQVLNDESPEGEGVDGIQRRGVRACHEVSLL